VPGSQGRHCDPVAASTEVPDGQGPMFSCSMRSGSALCSVLVAYAALLLDVAGA
jgi:hypothetical protein